MVHQTGKRIWGMIRGRNQAFGITAVIFILLKSHHASRGGFSIVYEKVVYDEQLSCTAKFFGKVFLVDLSANQFDSCRVCLVPPTEHDFDNGQLSSP